MHKGSFDMNLKKDKKKETDVQYILLIVVMWLMAICFAYIMFVKLKILFH